MLLVPGADAMHPPEVAALYARHLPDCRAAPPGAEPSAAIAAFTETVPGAAA